MSVPELIASTRSGEVSGLAGLYELYAADVHRTATRLLGNEAEAEDVVHDVFLGLPETLHRYHERGAFRAWLLRVTVRTTLMRMRRRRRRREISIDEATGVAAPWPPSKDEDLDRALKALPESLRMPVVLKYVEGYTHNEVAELLGTSVSASRVRCTRALAKLRALLIPEED